MPQQPKDEQGLSAEQIDALRAYRDQHGRRWESRLLAEWLSSTGDEGPELRQVRNTFGPSWRSSGPSPPVEDSHSASRRLFQRLPCRSR